MDEIQILALDKIKWAVYKLKASKHGIIKDTPKCCFERTFVQKV